MKRVLVVDDVRSIRILIGRSLQSMGYSVETAEDGEDAWSKVLSFAPDLVITDLLMPKLHGLDLLERIRNDARTKNIPVLCATSSDEQEDKNHAMNLGATGWVQKPFHPDTWGETLQQILT